jgi:hypothetical protein
MIMLFIQALTYNVTDPDDGSCERSSTATECRSYMSSLDSSVQMCYWEGDIVGDSSSGVNRISDVSGDCYFRDIGGDTSRVLMVALLSAVVGAPLSLSMQYVIANVMCKETIQEEGEEEDIVERKPAGVRVALDSIPPCPDKTSFVMRRHAHVREIVEEELQLSRDLAHMMTEMSTFRDALRAADDTVKLQAFDGKCVWRVESEESVCVIVEMECIEWNGMWRVVYVYALCDKNKQGSLF